MVIFAKNYITLTTMTTFTTFSVNDMVFVENVGYGTLMQCGNLKSIAIKEPPSLVQKRQSIYFDPELFNSESDTLTRQKSETAALVGHPKSEPNQETKIQLQVSGEKKQEHSKDKDRTGDVNADKNINIVKIRLEGTNALVYTLDQNMRKYVIVPVKPLFLPAMGTLNIKIQIGKTIQSFKKQILDLLGLKHSHYFNVKLFTTNPCLSELNCPGKTIWQYGIRESSILTMTAEHGFCFDNVPSDLSQHFSVLNNGLTFVSLPKKPKVVQNVPIVVASSATPKSVGSSGNGEEGKTQGERKQENAEKQKDKVQSKPGEEKTDENVTKQKKEEKKQKEEDRKEKEIEVPQSLRLNGDKLLRSGKQYFEVRIDKIPQNYSHLKIGVAAKKESKTWLFLPLLLQKVYEEGLQTKLIQAYGMTFKQNDLVGVLAKIDKHKNMRVTFFKNGVNLGVCFEGKVDEVLFVFEIGSEGQISLDSRVQPPLDSYRFR